ncbi:341e151e-c8f5-48a2-a6b5-f6e4095bcee6 [Thermothielavioides terrestris]|uniref:Glucose-methanol-choline oxidoreductase N-terminal domain-containing protein n=2 Tax=Thermothielavioides terrestris TaxID=2587410 RepID=G2R5J7_THETT|nr:uncharacterized protein THITE_2144836 [Thermothielavioides terrestris NRRL 8126]AEO67488.1 hypothetical protein THITE_2144836 [Thermothielavioides terrestris NRRL 8126]SPQ25617.1 341e151e-c8f5-48a2-a6b5-f6e4095bcee6 [Thermothielavioides terrestris]
MLFSAGVAALLALAVPVRSSGSSAFPAPGDASYEYVVVGGGTAGLAIAVRLAASGKSVAVVEAGGWATEMGNITTVPGYAFSDPVLAPVEDFPPVPLLDWELLSQPQTGANNRSIHYAAGKTLGGSSSINTMAYHRPTKQTHQRWADVAGHESYTWDNMLQFFEKSTTLTPPDWQKRATPNATFTFDPTVFCLSGKSSSCGPLQVSYSNWVDPTNTWFAVALNAVGLGSNSTGFNSGYLSGGAYTTETVDPSTATRSSSQTSYLDWGLRNTQIKVYNGTLASKVLFTSGKATGVSVSTNGTAYTLTATREVILSAGTFHSPQLLMLSGIGPRALLSSLGIPVISDLPGVGQNLQDPIFFSVQNGVTTPSLASELANPNQAAAILAEYVSNKTGPYSSPGGYIAFEKLPAASRANFSARTSALLAALPSDAPEIEYLAGSFAGTGDGVTTIGDLSAAILHPFSRGSVTIRSANISDPPVIDMGWLTDAADAEVAVAAFKRVRQAWSSPLLDDWKVGPEVKPGVSVQTDAQILDYVRENAIPIWHACATNAMGTNASAGAVVDWRAKVFGVDGLRVVDASALPFALPGHPQATIYAFAEKIAASILAGN